MRGRFEFTFHTVTEADARSADVDPTLALLGSQGWEIRAVTTLSDGRLSVALQRCHDDEILLPDAPSLSAALAEPLTVPPDEVERESSAVQARSGFPAV